MTALARTNAPAFILSVSAGPHKGAQYKINSSTITIGRASDNDISLEMDARCSRKHVEITFLANGPVIKNLSAQNKLLVNNDEVTEALLTPGAVIQIGDSELNYFTQAPPPPPSIPQMNGLAHSSNMNQQMVNAPDGQHGVNLGHGSDGITTPPRKQKSKKNFYIILAVIGSIVAMLMLSEVKQLKDPGIISDAELGARIEDTIKKTNEERKRIAKSGKTGRNFKIAQESYVSGFRDFERGNYPAAIESFQACLSLFPSHTLCGRYLKLSLRKKQELVQYYMVQGRKFMTSNQYRPCLGSFKNVMLLTRVKTNPIYKEAKANFEHCKVHNEGRY